MAILPLLTILSLAAAACSSTNEPSPVPPAAVEDGTAASPGAPPAPGEEPTPGEESPAPQGSPDQGGEGDGGEEPPAPPEPGEPVTARFEVEARGVEPVEGSFAPELLIARNPEEGATAADRSPVPGPANVLRGWDAYGKRALVVVLGGSQPDSSHRVVLSSIGFIREGTALLVGGRIGTSGEAAASVISTPWIVVSVNADAADVVSRCILALAGQDTRTTTCP